MPPGGWGRARFAGAVAPTGKQRRPVDAVLRALQSDSGAADAGRIGHDGPPRSRSWRRRRRRGPRATSHSGHEHDAFVRPYQDFIDPQLRSWRLGATVFTAFGFLALSIAVVGVFAVVSYVVAQRTREMGVRLALGATRRDVTTLVVRDSARLVGGGLLVGIALALAAGPLIASQLFQTSPREPASIALAALVLGGVTLLASFWPAWRAGGVNPVKT